MIDKFIDDVLNISNTREQFLTEVCLKSKYYNIVLKRLYITNMKHEEDKVVITLNDGRVQWLYISEDLECELRKTDLNLNIEKVEGF